MAMEQTKFLLHESDLPKQWYNIAADSPEAPTPVLHPDTKEPVTVDDLLVLLPMELIEQELTMDRFIDIPKGVLDIYRLFRSGPVRHRTA